MFFFPLLSSAAVTITSVSGASDVLIDTSSEAAAVSGTIVYGGMAGTCASPLTSSTCDTCTGAGQVVCNRKSIHGTLKLVISGTTSNTSLINQGAYPIVKRTDTNVVMTGWTKTHTTGQAGFSVEIDWSGLCGEFSSTACGTDFSSSINVGFTKDGTNIESGESITIKIVMSNANAAGDDLSTWCSGTTGTSYDGLCSHIMERGDEKAYVVEFGKPSTFPSASSGVSDIKYNKVLMFLEPATSTAELAATVLARVTNASDVEEFPVDTNQTPPITKNKVEGLENGTKYCFVAAHQDVAGNIYQFTDWASATALEQEELCATPEIVIGLLDDKKCFIATAAWGSALDSHVQVFRDFRNRYLFPYPAGRSFIKWYYQYGSTAADHIRKNEISRVAARVALWPLLIFAQLSLQWGLGVVLLVLAGIVILMRNRFFQFEGKSEL